MRNPALLGGVTQARYPLGQGHDRRLNTQRATFRNQRTVLSRNEVQRQIRVRGANRGEHVEQNSLGPTELAACAEIKDLHRRVAPPSPKGKRNQITRLLRLCSTSDRSICSS